MKVARTLVLLIGLPCIMLAALAGVVLASTQATFHLIGKVWA